MRVVALLLTSIVASVVGCAQSDGGVSDADSQDLTGTGTCRVLHEDAELVVLRGPDGKTMYAAKQLHVIDMKVTPASTNQSADWSASRFAAPHIQYVLGTRTRPESLLRLNQLVGPGTPPATVTVDAASAGVDTLIRPAATTYTANDDGSVNADLVDTASADPATPLMNAAFTRALLTTAHANATISCGGNNIPLAVTGASPVAFDINQAKVFTPGSDLVTVDAFIATASSIRAGAFKDPLAKAASADLDAKMTAFADVVDREIRPAMQAYGASMSRADLKVHIQTAWVAYRDLASLVLTTTKAAQDVDHLQSKNADGTYGFMAGTPELASQLLPSANTLRGNVDAVMAQTGDGWTLKDLK